MAQKMTDKTTFGVSFEEEPLFYLPYLMSNGGGFLPEELVKPESQQSLDFYADLRNKYHVAPKRQKVRVRQWGRCFAREISNVCFRSLGCTEV